MTRFEEIFARLRTGRHTALLGSGSCDLPEDLRTVVVDCAASRPVLEHARALANQLQREAPHARPFDRAADERLGLRRHLIGDELGRVALGPYADAFDRLTARNAPRTALLLFNVEMADVASLHGLIALLDSHALSVPTLFCFEEQNPGGPAQALFEAVLRSQGPDAIFQQESPPAPSVKASSDTWPTHTLPGPLRMLLRAAATMGPNFESEPLSQLLALDELEVLQGLQQARDAGLPIEDRGRGRFRMPAKLCHELAHEVLPSLASAWHERLAELFGGGPRGESVSEPESLPPEPAARRRATPTPPVAGSEPAQPAEDLLDRVDVQLPKEAAREHDWQEALENWTPQQVTPDPASRLTDEPRAADHAKRAGNLELAAEKYARAAERAARAGSHVVAGDYAERALELLREVPANERTRRMTVVALMSLGRARWQGAGSDDSASLDAALAALDECKELVDEGAPVTQRAELASLIADVCYDIGSDEALERALLELTTSGKELLAAHKPLEAARLLNDEAAIWVRVGDPVRAHYLLSRSREVFRQVISSYPEAGYELAQTEHMLARLLLHATPRPGRENDALKLGIEHATSAEQAYHDYGDQKSEARVWETLGRLQMRAGNRERAAALLDAAIHQQQQLGDHVGLARSTGALADLLQEKGEAAHALERLSDSIRHNLSTGSRGGLRFNLDRLRALTSDLPGELATAARELEQQLLERLRGS